MIFAQLHWPSMAGSGGRRVGGWGRGWQQPVHTPLTPSAHVVCVSQSCLPKTFESKVNSVMVTCLCVPCWHVQAVVRLQPLCWQDGFSDLK